MAQGHGLAFSNRSVDASHFSMVPRAGVPRSIFRVESTHKTTFNGGDLVPVYVEEVLPGDSFRVNMTAFARLATPIFPVMDNLHMDTFWFFVPCRLVWDNWQKFMGEQHNPGDSTDYSVPQVRCMGWEVGSLGDFFGLPTVNQAMSTMTFNALPFRCYYKIWNEWFRDENLQPSVPVYTGDADEDGGAENKPLLKRGKRHDYFTSCLPWPQKGNPVSLPLGTTAPVTGLGFAQPNSLAAGLGANVGVIESSAQGPGGVGKVYPLAGGTDMSQSYATPLRIRATVSGNEAVPAIYADLSAATAATINSIRNAFQIQRLLERDARGGTRYIELLRSHFGVFPPDFRLQRPEYLGGGSCYVTVNPIAQTSNPQTSTQTPIGHLAGVGHSVCQSGFSHSFTEHGYVLGLVSVRADLTYQQGLRRMWSRLTRYDFYWPVFAHLGEQPVFMKEIYSNGIDDVSNDMKVFGYQERWAEYRHKPSMITGMFRTGAVSPGLDTWHFAQFFGSQPILTDPNFIVDPTHDVVERAIAAGSLADGQQFLFDSVFTERRVRPMPAYSVPGYVDHF